MDGEVLDERSLRVEHAQGNAWPRGGVAYLCHQNSRPARKAGLRSDTVEVQQAENRIIVPRRHKTGFVGSGSTGGLTLHSRRALEHRLGQALVTVITINLAAPKPETGLHLTVTSVTVNEPW